MILKYNGNGEHIPGVPAQDLYQDHIDHLLASGLFDSKQALIDGLTSRGLYSVVKPPKKASKKTDETEITEDGS